MAFVKTCRASDISLLQIEHEGELRYGRCDSDMTRLHFRKGRSTHWNTVPCAHAARLAVARDSTATRLLFEHLIRQ
jgi:hypothetical protein